MTPFAEQNLFLILSLSSWHAKNFLSQQKGDLSPLKTQVQAHTPAAVNMRMP